MEDISGIIRRFKKLEKISTDKDASELLKISAQDFYKRKKSGTLLKLIIDRAINQKVDLNWLLTGEDQVGYRGVGEGENRAPIYKDVQGGGGRAVVSDEVEGLLRMTAEILASGTGYAASLAANVRSFHEAMTTARELDAMKTRIEDVERAIKSTAGRIRDEDPPGKKDEFLKKRAISSG